MRNLKGWRVKGWIGLVRHGCGRPIPLCDLLACDPCQNGCVPPASCRKHMANNTDLANPSQ